MRSYARVMAAAVAPDDSTAMRDALRAAFTDRSVVLAGGPVAGATGRVEQLRALGARRFLVLACGRGTGALPEGDDVEIEQWELPPAADVPASIRAEEALFADLPAPFRAALARFDPERDAIVLAPPDRKSVV